MNTNITTKMLTSLVVMLTCILAGESFAQTQIQAPMPLGFMGPDYKYAEVTNFESRSNSNHDVALLKAYTYDESDFLEFGYLDDTTASFINHSNFTFNVDGMTYAKPNALCSHDSTWANLRSYVYVKNGAIYPFHEHVLFGQSRANHSSTGNEYFYPSVYNNEKVLIASQRSLMYGLGYTAITIRNIDASLDEEIYLENYDITTWKDIELMDSNYLSATLVGYNHTSNVNAYDSISYDVETNTVTTYGDFNLDDTLLNTMGIVNGTLDPTITVLNYKTGESRFYPHSDYPHASIFPLKNDGYVIAYVPYGRVLKYNWYAYDGTLIDSLTDMRFENHEYGFSWNGEFTSYNYGSASVIEANNHQALLITTKLGFSKLVFNQTTSQIETQFQNTLDYIGGCVFVENGFIYRHGGGTYMDIHDENTFEFIGIYRVNAMREDFTNSFAISSGSGFHLFQKTQYGIKISKRVNGSNLTSDFKIGDDIYDYPSNTLGRKISTQYEMTLPSNPYFTPQGYELTTAISEYSVADGFHGYTYFVDDLEDVSIDITLNDPVNHVEIHRFNEYGYWSKVEDWENGDILDCSEDSLLRVYISDMDIADFKPGAVTVVYFIKILETPDTDGDEINDFVEGILDSLDTDNDGLFDFEDLDSDDDGYSDNEEYFSDDFDFQNNDEDSDGMINESHEDDEDSDGIVDALDPVNNIGIDEIDSDEFNYWTSDGLLYLESDLYLQIDIFDNIGRLIKHERIEDYSEIALHQGIYFIQLRDTDGRHHSFKLIL